MTGDHKTQSSIYSIANFVSYDHLSSSSSVFVASIDSISAPKTVTKALNHPSWKNAMLEEIRALEDNHVKGQLLLKDSFAVHTRTTLLVKGQLSKDSFAVTLSSLF